HRSEGIGRAGDGRRRARARFHRRGRGWTGQPGGRPDRGLAGRRGPRGRHHDVPGDRAGRALPDGGDRSPRTAGRNPGPRVSVAVAHARPLGMTFAGAAGAAALLALAPWVLQPFDTMSLAYGLIMAIAALGFNLLLGYTGLLSFGHSAYFGVGAYTV